jgi:hypothetical protein
MNEKFKINRLMNIFKGSFGVVLTKINICAKRTHVAEVSKKPDISTLRGRRQASCINNNLERQEYTLFC